MAKIGRNIREQRMKKGLSQEELAARLAFILLLYVISQVIAGYEEDAARTTYMMPCISLFMRLTGYPVLFLWTGSTVTSLIMAMTGGTSPFLVRKSMIHRAVLVPFAGCLLFMAPFSLSFLAMKIWAWAAACCG